MFVVKKQITHKININFPINNENFGQMADGYQTPDYVLGCRLKEDNVSQLNSAFKHYKTVHLLNPT